MNKGEDKKRVRRGPKDSEEMIRGIRKATSFNPAEYVVAERNRKSYNIKEMGAFIRALVLGVPLRERYDHPAINEETADALKYSFSCFNEVLKIIHTMPDVVRGLAFADVLEKFFAYGEQINKCRQELYGKFDKQVIAHYALALLSSAELQELADKKLVEESLAEELGVDSLEAEYDS